MSKCSYCGSRNYGPGCLYSPTKYHVHEDCGENECIYCGRNAYGYDCLFSQVKGRAGLNIHVHGHGNKCIYCGRTGVRGNSCIMSADGYHRF